MCIADQRKGKDDLDVPTGEASGETEDECERLREELEAMRRKRTALKNTRREELELLNSQYQISTRKLQRELPELAHIKTYRQFLQYYQRESNDTERRTVVPASTYIIQQETPLLSAMHRSFCVLPHQKTLIRTNYEHDIFAYLKKEIEALHIETSEVENRWLCRLSEKGDEIDELYEKYRNEVELVEMEVKKYRFLLWEQRAEKTLVEEGGKKGYGYISIASDTDHSESESDDSSSSRDDAPLGLLLNFFNSSSNHKEASSVSEASDSDTFQDHIHNFFQSFTSKECEVV